MSSYILKILETSYVTHDAKRFRIEKPDNYTFIPGQGTQVAINLPEWKDKFREFSFTSVNEAKYLEFTIKIYTDHDGVTKQLGKTNAGVELIIQEPYGNIVFKDDGVFIAAGSGITPFISIFRTLHKQKKLKKCSLIYSNRTAADIIYYPELLKMFGNRYINILTQEQSIGFMKNRIDRNYLIENIQNFSQDFYVCGPDNFVTSVTGLLLELGATADTLIF